MNLFLSLVWAFHWTGFQHFSQTLSLFFMVLLWSYISLLNQGYFFLFYVYFVILGANWSRVLCISYVSWFMASSRLAALSTGWLFKCLSNSYITSSGIFLCLVRGCCTLDLSTCSLHCYKPMV